MGDLHVSSERSVLGSEESPLTISQAGFHQFAPVLLAP
ncbi:hypothetical protein I541_3294 [Mycobacteroides abscessus]|nr:hypothetical protein L836_4250 [Mycobacteroides abscessus MAB_110811_2726]EUA75709.1 hypothetical protein I541_3294 [Mycobacteroides abscessus]